MGQEGWERGRVGYLAGAVGTQWREPVTHPEKASVRV